jgi:tetratricopeptide (TPR) repeat protein
MSDPTIKGMKRASPRANSSSKSTGSSIKKRNAPPKPIAKSSSADKAPARKAKKVKMTELEKPKKTEKKGAKESPKQQVASSKQKLAKSKATPSVKPEAPKTQAPKVDPAKKAPQKAASPAPQKSEPKEKEVKPQKNPAYDEAAALKAFNHAHKEFVSGKFAEARILFRTLIERYHGASEVTARARTYLSIAESRITVQDNFPSDADSLYDRGVLELNRGEYIAAQELFERAVKVQPEAPHILYGLAATRAKLGSVESAFEFLERAIRLQPTLRSRAQHDQDLSTLRTHPEFERIVFEDR